MATNHMDNIARSPHLTRLLRTKWALSHAKGTNLDLMALRKLLEPSPPCHHRGSREDYTISYILLHAVPYCFKLELKLVLRSEGHLLALYFREKAFSLFISGGCSEEQ